MRTRISWVELVTRASGLLRRKHYLSDACGTGTINRSVLDKHLDDLQFGCTNGDRQRRDRLREVEVAIGLPDADCPQLARSRQEAPLERAHRVVVGVHRAVQRGAHLGEVARELAEPVVELLGEPLDLRGVACEPLLAPPVRHRLGAPEAGGGGAGAAAGSRWISGVWRASRSWRHPYDTVWSSAMSAVGPVSSTWLDSANSVSVGSASKAAESSASPGTKHTTKSGERSNCFQYSLDESFWTWARTWLACVRSSRVRVSSSLASIASRYAESGTLESTTTSAPSGRCTTRSGRCSGSSPERTVSCSSKSQCSAMPAISTTLRSCSSPHLPRVCGRRSAVTRFLVSTVSCSWDRRRDSTCEVIPP